MYLPDGLIEKMASLSRSFCKLSRSTRWTLFLTRVGSYWSYTTNWSITTCKALTTALCFGEMCPHSSPLRAYDQCVDIKYCYTALINALNTCKKEYVTRTLRKANRYWTYIILVLSAQFRQFRYWTDLFQLGSTESKEGEEPHKAKNEYSPRLSGRSLKRTTLCIAIHILLNEVVIFLNHPMPSRLTAASFLP
jgi:hypothetical protein